MATITIMGKKLELDIFDADQAEKVDTAIENARKALESIHIDNGKLHVVIRQSCEAVFECFNTIFGDGTDRFLFGERTNMLDCAKAMDELREAVGPKQEEAFQKYLPNRQSRRAK